GAAAPRCLRHASDLQLAPPGPRLGRGGPGTALHSRAGLRRDRCGLPVPPRGFGGCRDRRRGLRSALPLLPRGRRALLPAAGARLGGPLRAGRRGRAPPLQPPGAPLRHARPGQLSFPEEPLPPADLSPDPRQPAPHLPAHPGPRPPGPGLRAAPGACLPAGLRLAVAEPPGPPAPEAGDPGAEDRAAARDRPLVPSRGDASVRVALIGSRGIPGRYGGYETLMEELAVRLVARGFQVTVYCRSHSTPRSLHEYRGAELVVLPTI